MSAAARIVVNVLNSGKLTPDIRADLATARGIPNPTIQNSIIRNGNNLGKVVPLTSLAVLLVSS